MENYSTECLRWMMENIFMLYGFYERNKEAGQYTEVYPSIHGGFSAWQIGITVLPQVEELPEMDSINTFKRLILEQLEKRT